MDSYKDDELSSARLLNEKKGRRDDEDATIEIPLKPSPTSLQTQQPPPTSRWTAWAQIAAGHLIVFDTFGYIGSWGFFEAYYVDAFDRPLSDIAWVGSIQIFLVYLIGALSGRALDAGYLRHILTIGCAMQILAIFSTSLVTSYWQLFITQGLLSGIGNGLVFCPIIALVSTYYDDSNRALAVAFVAMGGATGGMAFPAIAKNLLGQIGQPWTLRVMGFLFLANSGVALALVRVRVLPRKQGPLFEWAAFREWPFLLYTVGCFLTLWGVYFTYSYISVFSTTVIHVPKSQGFYFIMGLNAIGLLGRTVPAWLVPKCGGVLNVFVPCVFLAGSMLFLWSLVSTETQLIFFIVIYGFLAHSVQSLFVGGVGSLTKDPRKMGARTGMVFSAISIACLTGPPIAGKLIDLCDGDFLFAQIFGGTVMICGSVALFGANWIKDLV